MGQKRYNFSDEELKHIIEEVTKRVINEMAIPRKEYVRKAYDASYSIMEHLAKICLFEDIVPHCVPHWRTEIYAFCEKVVTDRIKGNINKEKAFEEGAIEWPFGRDFEELDAKLFDSIIFTYKNKPDTRYRIYTEETGEEALNRSLGRIFKFYDGFKDAAVKNDINLLSVALDDFVNNE